MICEFCLWNAARHAKRAGYYSGLANNHVSNTNYYMMWMAAKHRKLTKKWVDRALPWYKQIEQFV